MKIMAFAKARSFEEREKFQSSCLEHFSPEWRPLEMQVKRLVVDLVDVTPGHMPWQRPGEATPVAAIPPYDAVIEVWFATGEEARKAAIVLMEELDDQCQPIDVLMVTEHVEKNWPVPAKAGRSPGIKYISLCSFHDDLPASAAKRSWKQHVPLAVKVHVGVSKYVRNWVEEPLSGDSTPVNGVVEMHFATMDDLEQRWFDSDRGRDEIIQDVGHFLKGAQRMFTTEYIVCA
jgi:hypothetical protein